jgi:multiple sugar transport system ATP-binding protein
LTRLHQRLATTFIYVTHDQVEAMTMASRIAVMKDGVLQQCDEPENVYRRPANKFVAGFIGAPPMNFFKATVANGASGVVVDAGDFKLPLLNNKAASAYVGKPVTLGIRPEAIFDANIEGPVKANEHNVIMAKVDVLEPLGHEYVAYLKTDSHNFVATIDPGTKIQIDDVAKFVVNLDELHIFDADTEAAIR